MTRLFLILILLLACAAPLLAQDKTTLEGQIVCCAECWAEADRTKVEFGTAADLLKSQSCVANGDPTLIAVRKGDKFTLYQLEQAKFRLPGKNWLEFIGKHVAVTGTVQNKKNVSVIRVDKLEVVAPSLAEQESAKIVGTQVELTLKDLSGVSQSLAALKGRVVVLNFWATYCIPCKAEMPDLAAIQNEYAALGVQVIGASTDEIGDRDKVVQFIKESKINFPIWVEATTADLIRFGLGGALPGTVVVGKDGSVARVISGVVNLPELRKQIAILVALPATVATGATKPPEEIATKDPRVIDASSVPS